VLTTQEAYRIVAEMVRLPAGTEYLSLSEACGHVLAEPLSADTDLPPFDQVRMDGFAVRYSEWNSGVHVFTPVGVQRAGSPEIPLPEGPNCIEVTTGSVVPPGADVIIPVEHIIRTAEGHVQIDETKAAIRYRQHIEPKASHHTKGDILVSPGLPVTSPIAGIAASVGRDVLAVLRQPNVSIVSTGDELVDINTSPLPYQIRRSNSYALQVFFRSFGIAASSLHLPDEPEQLTRGIREALRTSDLLILSGGVSRGSFDHVPDVLEALGVEKVFHRIAQKPGKPMWFGRTSTAGVFALPGNPISALACAARYIAPLLRKRLGRAEELSVFLREPVAPHPSMSLLIPVEMILPTEAQPLPWKGSGDFSALARAHGFVEIQPGYTGGPVPFYSLFPHLPV